MKKHLITFADGTDEIKAAGSRLFKQAAECEWFDTLSCWNLSKIKSIDYAWFNKHETFINNNPRGFGYWIWKSKIIELMLNFSSENDIVIYMDSGCEINPNGKEIFNKYLDIAIKTDFFAFYLDGPNYTTQQWTKRVLFDEIFQSLNSKIDKQPQIEATFLMVKNNSKSREIISRWQKIAIEKNYLYSNDELCTNESDFFIEHRHDQAILSLILYSEDYGCTTRNENYFPELWKINLHPKYSPIAAFRNLTGMAKINSMNLI